MSEEPPPDPSPPDDPARHVLALSYAPVPGPSGRPSPTRLVIAATVGIGLFCAAKAVATWSISVQPSRFYLARAMFPYAWLSSTLASVIHVPPLQAVLSWSAWTLAYVQYPAYAVATVLPARKRLLIGLVTGHLVATAVLWLLAP